MRCHAQREPEPMESATFRVMNCSHAGRSSRDSAVDEHDVRIPPLGLAGDLHVPKGAWSLVAFAHGSGSSRLSPRNRAVARVLNGYGIATLLFDLLSSQEEADRANVFDIPLLADRLVNAVHWLDGQPSIGKLPLGLFGASTGAAAALVAAAKVPNRVGAVVSRGGRPDLAGDALDYVSRSDAIDRRRCRLRRHRAQRAGIRTPERAQGPGNRSGRKSSFS